LAQKTPSSALDEDIKPGWGLAQPQSSRRRQRAIRQYRNPIRKSFQLPTDRPMWGMILRTSENALISL
jgi:hypothetical protein